ncbi:uncharacterized protein ACNS7B_022514 isoform 2-T2 [Menidia menidia]
MASTTKTTTEGSSTQEIPEAIGNNLPSPESFRQEFPTPTQKTPGGSSLHLSSDFSGTRPGRSGGGTGDAVCLLDDELLPEMSLLDDTCDPTVHLAKNDSLNPGSAPATPKVFATMTRAEENHSDPPKPMVKTTTTTTESDVGVNSPSVNKSAASSNILERYWSEITLLDVSRDSVPSPVRPIAPMDITQDISPLDSKTNRSLSNLVEHIGEEPGRSDTIQEDETSSTSVHSVNRVRESTLKTSLDVTQETSVDSVLENSKVLSKSDGQNIEESQASPEHTFDTKPANITHDISFSNDGSTQGPQLSTSGNTTLNIVNSGQESEPMESLVTVEAKPEERLNNCDSELTDKGSHQVSATEVSCNGTFTVVQPSHLSACSDPSSASTSCLENKTLDLPAPSVNSPKLESEAQPVDTKASCVQNKTCLTVNEVVVQNATFDRCSLEKSSDRATSEETSATGLQFQNNTFDCKPPPQQNATTTLSEASSGDTPHNTLDEPASPKPCNLPTSLKVDCSEVHPPELPKPNGAADTAESDAKHVGGPNGTFEASPVLDSVPGIGGSVSKDNSSAGLPLAESLSDASSYQSMDTENDKANAFNLDETLDLRADNLITSTPMTNCKIFNLCPEREAGKILEAQRKRYRDGPGKPADQAPSNIVCDRKTFLTQSAAKIFWPPSVSGSQLLKSRPAPTRPKGLEPGMSGLPPKRQRIQAEAARGSALPSGKPQGTTGIPKSYNLRSTAAASRPPCSGLPRPQFSGIPSAVQRATQGLRPPSARLNTAASSTADKPCEPTAKLVTKNLPMKKQPLTREALPISKKKKLDTFVPNSDPEVPTSVYDTTNKNKNLKPATSNQRVVPAKIQRNGGSAPSNAGETLTLCNAPSRAGAPKQPAKSQRAQPAKPQGHGCTRCSTLEDQLKEKSEENQRLKEELLKSNKQADC